MSNLARNEDKRNSFLYYQLWKFLDPWKSNYRDKSSNVSMPIVSRAQRIKRFEKYLDERLSSFHFLKESRPKSREISQACDSSRACKTVCSPNTPQPSVELSDHLLPN